MFSLSLTRLTFVPKYTGVVVSTLVAVVAIPGVVMTCAGVVQFVLCLQILFALMCGGFIWAVLNDKIPAKTGKGGGSLTEGYPYSRHLSRLRVELIESLATFQRIVIQHPNMI